METTMETLKAQEGTWTLTAPDGRTWQSDSPLGCVRAEQRERVPDEVALARIWAAVDESDFTERHVQLGSFYTVKNMEDLIDKMEGHIARLQGRLLAPAARVAEIHMSRYTVEWLDGPLPKGSILHKALPVRQEFSFAPQHVREG